MVRRSQRIISPETKNRLLEAIQLCREASCLLSAQAPIYGPEYKTADAMRKALDDMAGVLTGNREHFWRKDHSTPKGMHVSCDDKAS